MGDLKAVRNGQPPLLARQKFNVEALEQLEEGMAIETLNAAGEKMYSAESVAMYRMILVIMGVLSALLLVVILFMAMNK